VKAGYREGKDFMANIRRVCTLESPIYLRELRQNPILKTAGFVRGDMRGRARVSDHWPELYAMIIARNPSVRRTLGPTHPTGWLNSPTTRARPVREVATGLRAVGRVVGASARRAPFGPRRPEQAALRPVSRQREHRTGGTGSGA
jgi:hypothetical protein